jgi:hypothetical protein
MKKVLVTLDIALKLNELGFDLPCFANYWRGRSVVDFKDEVKGDSVSVDNIAVLRNGEAFDGEEVAIAIPTWELVFEWFRGKGYEVCIDYVVGNTCTIYKVNVNASGEELEFDTERFYTYEEAREFVVKEIIKEYEYNN